MDIWVYSPDPLEEGFEVAKVNELVPAEEWVAEHGVVNYPGAIYFFADLTPPRSEEEQFEIAALWGSAENRVYPLESRLKFALRALELMGN